MKKILTSTYKVRFQDCDPFNHLNNARYLEYFINAREDQLLENYQFDIFEIMRRQGLSWVVATNQISYFKPASTMETITIDSQLIAYTPKSVQVEMRMWDEKKSELKALLWSNFIHFDLKTQKTLVHSPEFARLFEDILLPVEETNFEDRRTSFFKQKPV